MKSRGKDLLLTTSSRKGDMADLLRSGTMIVPDPPLHASDIVSVMTTSTRVPISLSSDFAEQKVLGLGVDDVITKFRQRGLCSKSFLSHPGNPRGMSSTSRHLHEMQL
jgi:hypothetical protein